jgi:Leu/Phe-tRNA-protein transferase
MRLGTSMAIVFGLSTAFLQPVFANNSAAINASLPNLDCSSLLVPGTKEQMDQFEKFISGSLSDEEKLELIFRNWEDNAADALGTRGFMGSLAAVPNTPLASEIALRHGIMPWGVAFRLVDSLDTAIELRRKSWNHLVDVKKQPFAVAYAADLFFIGDVKSATGLTFGPVPEGKVVPEVPVLDVPVEAMRKLIAQGAWEIGPAPDFKATFIAPDRLARRLDPAGVNHHYALHRNESWGYNSFTQSGWVAFPRHGLHDFSTWKESAEAKRLEKLMFRLLDRGYKFRFNHDYIAAIEALKNQRRSFRDHLSESKERKELQSHENRYSENRDEWKTSLAKLQAGKGYSVEVYNEAGTLVGGEIGWRVGNHFYGDSPFYSDEDIDLAKIAAFVLMRMLYENGMAYSDPGMITAYTDSMGAEQPTFAEFNRKMRTAPKEVIQVPALYDPRTPEYFAKKFQELERKKTAGLGSSSFVSRMPDHSPTALAAAVSVKAVPGALSIVVVGSEEQALTHAKQIASPGLMPLFLITSQAANPEESAVDYLKRLLLVDERREATVERNRVVEAHGATKNAIAKAREALASGKVTRTVKVNGEKVKEVVILSETELAEYKTQLEAAELALPETEKAVNELRAAPVPALKIVFYPNPKFPSHKVIPLAQFEAAMNLEETTAGLSWLKTTDLASVALPADGSVVAMEAIGWTFPER